jgi:hypothetical protein
MFSTEPKGGSSTWWNAIPTCVSSSQNSFLNSFAMNAARRRQVKLWAIVGSHQSAMETNEKNKNGLDQSNGAPENKLSNVSKTIRWNCNLKCKRKKKTVDYYLSQAIVLNYRESYSSRVYCDIYLIDVPVMICLLSLITRVKLWLSLPPIHLPAISNTKPANVSFMIPLASLSLSLTHKSTILLVIQLNGFSNFEITERVILIVWRS